MPTTSFTRAPWLRVIKLILASGKKTHTINSDGTGNGLRVDCQIYKSNMSLANPSTFTIYNLQEGTREGIKQGGTVEVAAGWQNFAIQTIFKGGIKSVLNMRHGSDILTEIGCQPLDFKANYAIGAWNFPQGTEVKQAALTIARAIPEASIAENDFRDIAGTIGEGGWCQNCSPQDALIKMGEQFKFNVWADDTKVKAKSHTSSGGIGSAVMELSGDGGALIDINPIYIGPYRDAIKQVTIKSLFVPGIAPGSTVRLKSSLNPRFNKDYTVAQFDATLSAYDDRWLMSLTCWNGAAGQ
jgi:hypothetical protein